MPPPSPRRLSGRASALCLCLRTIARRSDRRLLPRCWLGGQQLQRGGAKIANIAERRAYPREFLDGHAVILPIDKSPHRRLGHFEADAVAGARGRAAPGVM